MHLNKPVCVFVIEKTLGGVAYMNINIINNSSLRNQFYLRVILLSQTTNNSVDPLTDTFFNADEVIDLAYDPYANKYYNLKKLSDAIGTEEGVLVCNEQMEMEAIHLFPTPKTVYQIIHDFYYIKLFVRYSYVIDVFLSHTQFFRDVILSAGIHFNSIYTPHGVGLLDWNLKKQAGPILKVVFTGRLVDSKGPQHIYPIDQELKKRGIVIDWTIIGRGPLKNLLTDQWKQEKNVRFLSPDSNKDVILEMIKNDVFILPTTFEGSPVSILEALGCGLVPVVSDLPAGIREVVTEGVGYRIGINNIKAFADAIEKLHHDRNLLQQMQHNCRKLAEDKFDIKKTSDGYFSEFLKYKEYKRDKEIPKLNYGSKLDKPYFPDSFVKMIRRGKKSLK